MRIAVAVLAVLVGFAFACGGEESGRDTADTPDGGQDGDDGADGDVDADADADADTDGDEDTDADADADADTGGLVLHGGIGTVSEGAVTSGTLRLKEMGFEFGARVCSGSLCLRGGVTS